MAPLAGCLALLSVTGSTGYAQEPPDTVYEVKELEVVVGSRAGVADPATLPVPVDIYGSEEIARLGAPPGQIGGGQRGACHEIT